MVRRCTLEVRDLCLQLGRLLHLFVKHIAKSFIGDPDGRAQIVDDSLPVALEACHFIWCISLTPEGGQVIDRIHQ